MTTEIAIRYCDEYLKRHISDIDKEFLIAAKEALQQEQKSEWEHDHEILKAYSDGANDVLDKIRAEIAELEEGILSYHNDRPWVFKDEVLQIIDKYMAEGSGEE